MSPGPPRCLASRVANLYLPLAHRPAQLIQFTTLLEGGEPCYFGGRIEDVLAEPAVVRPNPLHCRPGPRQTQAPTTASLLKWACDDAGMRALHELIEVEDPAWPVLLGEVAGAVVPVEVLGGDVERGRAVLGQLQVSARSYLGGLVLNCGGLLVDGGWLRVFGSPDDAESAGLPGLAEVNGMPAEFDPAWRPDAGLVVAQDVLGGVFALNGADPAGDGRPGGPGEVVYFAPEALRWEALGAGYSAWLSWVLGGDLKGFYEGVRWPGWREEVAGLRRTEGFAFYPPLWTAEARQDLRGADRRSVPMGELVGAGRESCLQLDGIDPGFLGIV
ncbi:DUF2625 family protein [Streptomyces sp. NPDC059533]|uniref:DUF2625 family protein n=1 Tax=unclassified Streptomyces TaxID=2593676 RepID=UPI0036B7F591